MNEKQSWQENNMNDPKKEQPNELTDEELEKVSGGKLLNSKGSQQTNEGEGEEMGAFSP